jgi:glycosyltransferase involved in cell wall biosynthesis
MEREAADSVGATILINDYNYARFLPAAIDSALSQTYRPLEVVVVDDGSTDESPDIIRNYGNRIRPIFKSNGGQASAFNAGFAASRGEVICLLDADDFFFPEKAERSVSALLAHPEVGWVFHPVHREDSEGHSESVPPLDKPLFIDIRDGALRGKLPGPPGPVTSGIVMSRDLMSRILPLTEAIRITADNYLIFLASALSPGIYLEEALAVQRIHDANHYTLRPDRLLIEARIHLLIAEEMRRRHPELRRLSNHIFSRAVANYHLAATADESCSSTVRTYVRNASLVEWPDLFLRAAYHRIRRRPNRS